MTFRPALAFVPALALVAAGTLTAAAPRRDTVPSATPAGEPVSCIQLTQIKSQMVRSDRVIDFELKNGKVYRNELPYRCPSLGFEERFLHKTTLNQLCSIDTITVLESPGLRHGATCGLGKFQPVVLAKKRR